jgi:molybdopterin synthase sulfur carrier subunit
VTIVRIPPILRPEADGHREIEAAGATVREVLEALLAAHPGLEGRILSQGRLPPFLNLYLDGTDVKALDGLDTAVDPASTLLLLPAMAGG